ncbi:MAG: Tn3 family transposase [Candidatus Acidiferrales bacterium]
MRDHRVPAALLVWNTVRIAEIVHRLRASGEEILDTDLARVSPLPRAHIIPTGTYSFEQEMPGVDFAHNTLPEIFAPLLPTPRTGRTVDDLQHILAEPAIQFRAVAAAIRAAFRILCRKLQP